MELKKIHNVLQQLRYLSKWWFGLLIADDQSSALERKDQLFGMNDIQG